MKAIAVKMSNCAKVIYAAILAAIMPVFYVGTNYCSRVSVNTNATTENVLGGVIGVIIEIAKYVGIVLAISGVFMLILAYKDDNADGQSRAVRLVVVAVALLGLRTLLKVTGLIS